MRRNRFFEFTNSRSVPAQILLASLLIGLMVGAPILLLARPADALMVGSVTAGAVFVIMWFYQLKSRLKSRR